MFGWARSLYDYTYRLIYPQPPPGAGYGFRWQAGQGVPDTLSTYDVRGTAVPPGIYVVFNGSLLDLDTDPFGRDPGEPGPVFTSPAVVSDALRNLVSSVAHNPPSGEPQWANPDPVRLRDLDGFLSYVAGCLDLINQTASGATLLSRLNTAPHAVFISPGSRSNQTFGGVGPALDRLTAGAMQYASGGAIPKAEIASTVQARYANIRKTQAKYDQLAADMNAAPLYSLFVAGNAFTPNYLATNFRFRGKPLAGQHLLNWVSDNGFSAFDAALRGMTAKRQDNVVVRDFFLLAMCTALYPSARRGRGTQPGISFSTKNADDNNRTSSTFRPPAIGLAHELVHAMHYSRGSSPGVELSHYSTTAAELLFAGIGPSASLEPVNENAIRAEWRTIRGPIDPSNRWASPVPRTTYEAPIPPDTRASMRARFKCF